MTRTISLYFARQFAGNLLRTLMFVCFLIYLIDFIEFARRAGSVIGFTYPAAMLTSLLRMPSLIETYMPLIVQIAAIYTLLALNKRSELVITRASGLSAWQFVAPFFGVALLIGAASVAVLNPLSARTIAMVYDREAALGLSNPGTQEIVPYFRQKGEDGGIVIIGATGFGDGGRKLFDATFLFVDAMGTPVERIDAAEATLSAGVWTLRAVQARASDGTVTNAESRMIPSTLPEDMILSTLRPAETVSLSELPGQVLAAESTGVDAGAYRMQFHALLASPALIAAMTLIAATVSMKYARFGSAGTAVLGGIAAGFLLYVVTTMVKAFGAADIVPPVVAAWFPVIVAMFIGVTFLLYREDG